MNVTFTGDLRRVSSEKLEGLTKQSKALGMEKCWSSKQMYDHLQTLEELVPRTVCLNRFIFFHSSVLYIIGGICCASVDRHIPFSRLRHHSSSAVHDPHHRAYLRESTGQANCGVVPHRAHRLYCRDRQSS